MPPNKISRLPRGRFGVAKQKPPPEVMTWGRAAPVLALCVIFDALRLMFTFFIFFGPALAAVGCTIGVNSVVGTTIAEMAGKVTAGVCAAGAGALGFFGSGVIETFGIIMAMAVGLLGWATVTLILVITNPRIWTSNAFSWIWSLCSLGVSEIPFVSTIPMLTITHWRLYLGQIRHDRAALKKYRTEQERVASIARSIKEQRLLAQSTQQTQAEQQNALDRELAEREAEEEMSEQEKENYAKEVVY